VTDVNGAAHIVIDQVSHEYRPARGRPVLALDNFSLAVSDREFVKLVAPAEDDGIAVEFFEEELNALFEFGLAGDANATQHGLGHFAKERLHQVQPGTVLGREDEIKTVRSRREVGTGFLG